MPLLSAAWSLEGFRHHVWYEQAAVLTLLGYKGLDTRAFKRHIMFLKCDGSYISG
jgi:hypothetical protein